MSEPVQFLTSFAQALQTMTLYGTGHPARERAIEHAYDRLLRLQAVDQYADFSFLGADVVYRRRTMRELKEWDWGTKLANAGIQRIEFIGPVERDDFDGFLEDILQRIGTVAIDSATVRQERGSNIRYGAVGVKGTGGLTHKDAEAITVAGIAYTLREEADTVRWMHEEVQSHGQIPLLEAETVVRSLSVAMHGGREIVIPLVQLKEFDQYTTTHSLNVSVLTMALAEYLGLGAKDVRAFGVAGLLHDLGKVRIPKEILTKPGRLTDDEWEVMKKHPADGARIIVESDRMLDLAAVVAYEHHIMINGGGYPSLHFHRECHQASKLVHICDVYDALRTNRPYRDAWEAEAALRFIESRVKTDFDPDLVNSFSEMMKSWEGRLAVVDEETPVQSALPPEPIVVEGEDGEIIINLRDDDEGLKEVKSFVWLKGDEEAADSAAGEIATVVHEPASLESDDRHDEIPVYEIRDEDDELPVYLIEHVKGDDTPAVPAPAAAVTDDDDLPVYEIGGATKAATPAGNDDLPVHEIKVGAAADDDLPVYEIKGGKPDDDDLPVYEIGSGKVAADDLKVYEIGGAPPADDDDLPVYEINTSPDKTPPPSAAADDKRKQKKKKRGDPT
jgi:putative nucleotidyltransferase with HDIG domain